MPQDDLDKAKDQLGGLGPRQREVLGLVCDGLEYEDIAERLHISENTVKSHMRQVYLKLDLTDIKSRTQRGKKLHQVYCPLLEAAAIPPAKPDADEPQPVPEEVQRLVEEDQKALVLWQPKPGTGTTSTAIQAREQPLPPQIIRESKPPRPLRWMVLGIILGAVLIAAIAWQVVQTLRSQVASLAHALINPVVVTSQVTVMVSEPPRPTGTALVVVVTATPLRPTNSPQPSDTPALPTNTLEPTSTPTPSVALPFEDNFDSGLRPEWRVLGGAPITINGRLTAAEADLAIEIGDSSWGDYKVEFDYYKLYPHVVLLVFGQKLRYRMASEQFQSNGAWEAFENNKWVAISDAGGVGDFGRLRVVIEGNSYHLFIDGSAYMDIVYGTQVKGPFGLQLEKGAVIDNFKITSP